MSKWFLRFAAIFAVVLLLAGCGTAEENGDDIAVDDSEDTGSQDAAEQNGDTILVTISIDDGSEYVDEKEIPIEEGENLMDIMKQNFYVEEEEGTITSIERVSAEEGEAKGWRFFIDGEMSTVDAGDYKPSPGEEIIFDFQSLE
jgi:hypothetical protein